MKWNKYNLNLNNIKENKIFVFSLNYDPSDKRHYAVNYVDDDGYNRRNGNLYRKENADTYSVTYVCIKSKCELSIKYD